jgi:lysophospholipase L1-like esterase
LKNTVWHKALKRLLDVAIGVYALMIPLVIATGGFRFSLLGVGIRASHVYTPVKILLPLILLRLLISMAFKNFLLLTGSILVGLAGVEAGVRVWDPPISRPFHQQLHRASPIYVWELNPGASGTGGFGEAYHVSPEGYRDYPGDRQIPAGAGRIMVIGDSFTFGPSVDMAETYPARLERALTDRGIAVEVINWGVIGYNMWQYIEVLTHKVLPLKPDLVVLGLFFNDIGEHPPEGYGTPGFKGYNPFARGFDGGWLAHSALFTLLDNLNFAFETKFRHRRGHRYLAGVAERRRHLGPQNPDQWPHKLMYGKAKPEVYARFEAELRRFADIAAAARVPLLVALIPDAAQLHNPPGQAVNRIVRRFVENLGLPFVDLTPVLEKEPDPRTLYLFPKDAHNSPKGYRIIGETLAGTVVDEGLLPLP